MAEGWLMDVETACVFWDICCHMKLETEEQRKALLRILVKDKKVKYLRDPQTYFKDKRVLVIKHNKNKEN